ncbi:hypothetical protein C9J98_01040 [Stenotrophomonas panacihumi]|nr:hypothetical protein C9J98_01040 [Stenotrophomonas panacihumi]
MQLPDLEDYTMDFIALTVAALLLIVLGGISTSMAWRAARPRARWCVAAAAFWAAGCAWAAAACARPTMDATGVLHDTALPFAALAYLFTLFGALAFAWAAWGWRVHAVAARRSVA